MDKLFAALLAASFSTLSTGRLLGRQPIVEPQPGATWWGAKQAFCTMGKNKAARRKANKAARRMRVANSQRARS